MRQLMKGFSMGKEDAVKAGKFLGGAALVFAVLHIAASFIPIEIIETFFASISLFILSLFGVSGELIHGEPVIILLQDYSLPITISYLCTGLFEMLVLASLIAASFGIEIRKRALGILGGIVTLAVFNILRIVATIGIILNAGIVTAEFGHDLLFRVFLFAAIAGYYAAWFYWATAGFLQEKQKKQAKGD